MDIESSTTNTAYLWSHWSRTFINFLEATKVTEDKEKLNILINFVSPAVFEHINECKTYEEAIDVLKNLYIKPQNEIFARHSLSLRKQEVGESIDQYLQILKQMSKDCNFKAVSADQNREDFIRDSFIAGLNSSHIRQRLLEQSTLTLSQTFDSARALEMAQRHSESYLTPFTSHANAVTSRNLESESQSYSTRSENDSTIAATLPKCYFCGQSRHPRSNCPARNISCHSCGKMGHFTKVCKSKSQKPVNTLSKSAAGILGMMSTMSPTCLSKSLIRIKVNETDLEALIDTGSSDSYISNKVAYQENIEIFPSKLNVTMASSALSSPVVGFCIITLKILNHTYNKIKLYVLEELCADVIIGHDLLRQHSKVQIDFGGPKSPISICNLALAQVEPYPLFAHLTDNYKPIAVKSRRYSFADLEFIETEIQNLLKENIIEPSNSPWRAQVLVTKNENHKSRMVVDYSLTINKFTSLDAYPLPKIEELVHKISQYEYFSSIDLRSAYHQIPILEHERIYTGFEACGNLYQFTRIPFGVTNGVACFQRIMNNIIQKEGLQDIYAFLDDVTICGKSKENHDQNLQKFLNVAEKYSLTLNKEKCKFGMTKINILGYTIERKSIKPDADRLRPLIHLPLPKDTTSLRRIQGMFAHYSKFIYKFSEKIHPLVDVKQFPLQGHQVAAFHQLKNDLINAVVASINDEATFTVETDASEYAIAAQLTQLGRPVAFFSRTLSKSEQRHSSVEKEAYAIVEALRKWRHFLIGRHFQLITDQRSVAFMFDNKSSSKIKNEKIMRWRLELSCYKYDIICRPGNKNIVADALSTISAAIMPATSDKTLYNLHDVLCHPGITRLYHWIRCKNLPYSLEDIKRITSSCPVCAEIKPRFYKNQGTLIKATAPFERLNLDFKGPLPSVNNNHYMLTIVDEYSRFPFAFACSDINSSTIINCLTHLFSVFGTPSYIHTDRGSSFMSRDLKIFLTNHGIATSRTTPYNPQGNGQCERYNGIIWRTIQLTLKSKNRKITQWQEVLLDSLHSIRSLLCTATNCSPHERMFNHPRRSSNGASMPSWLSVSGPVYLKKHVRRNKYEPLVEEVELLEANTDYAHIRLANGNETTVSTRHLAPIGYNKIYEEPIIRESINEENSDNLDQSVIDTDQIQDSCLTPDLQISSESTNVENRPSRKKKPPAYLEDYIRK